jgi:uncharacterized protein (DUF433 family)
VGIHHTGDKRESHGTEQGENNPENVLYHRHAAHPNNLPDGCKSTLPCISLRIMTTEQTPLITSSSDVLGGTAVFANTRVPVQTLIDHLEGGETIDDFLEGFPTVTQEQVLAYLRR